MSIQAERFLLNEAGQLFVGVLQISLCACDRMRRMGSTLPGYLHVTSSAHTIFCVLC